MKDIEKLFEIQKIDKERAEILNSVENGNAKRNYDNANKTIEGTKIALLGLENEAKNLQESFSRVAKVLSETFANIEKEEKNNSSEEDKISVFGTLLTRISVLESQLADMDRKIREQTVSYENAKISIQRAQEVVKKYAPEYEQQKGKINGKVDELTAKINEALKKIDCNLASKYKTIRTIVPLIGNQCGGCSFEMPKLAISNIKQNGWIICGECGKIIYDTEAV
jgi:predicted  nucleic acid-binding Zn-ribbon protein